MTDDNQMALLNWQGERAMKDETMPNHFREEYKPNYCEDCGCFIEQDKQKCNKCYLKEVSQNV